MKWLLQVGLAIVGSGVLVYVVLTGLRGSEPLPAGPATPAERGKALAERLGCVACHSLDGSTGIGPTWMGIYGFRRSFADGRSAAADENYLQRSMREPGAEVVAGFDNMMLPAPLNDEQIADIIALIRELTRTMPQ